MLFKVVITIRAHRPNANLFKPVDAEAGCERLAMTLGDADPKVVVTRLYRLFNAP
jgi:hypothetical protein